MNWNKDQSVLLSKFCILLFAVTLGVLCVASPWMRRFTLQIAAQSLTVNWYTVSLIAIAVPAYTALFFLYRMLSNISRDRIFVAPNVRCLRVISWCCFASSLIFLASSFYSISWLVLAVMAAFGGLILRVVKNVFAAAVALKDEHDLTI